MTFLNLPDKPANQVKPAAVLLPLAYGGCNSTCPDAGKAAESVLEASQLLSLWDAETKTDLSTLGLHCLDILRPQGDAQSAVDEIYQHSAPFFRKGQVVAAVGGSHVTSLGLIRAASEEQQAASVLHLAAHPHVGGGLAQESDDANCMARVREKCVVVQA